MKQGHTCHSRFCHIGQRRLRSSIEFFHDLPQKEKWRFFTPYRAERPSINLWELSKDSARQSPLFAITDFQPTECCRSWSITQSRYVGPRQGSYIVLEFDSCQRLLMQEICQRARTIGGWFIQTRLANVQVDLTHSFCWQDHSWKKLPFSVAFGLNPKARRARLS